MTRKKNYIYVTNKTGEPRNPWKLVFKGKTVEALSQYNEDDLFRYPTGRQALTVALRLQTYTHKTTVVVDPSLEKEEEIDHARVIVDRAFDEEFALTG